MTTSRSGASGHRGEVSQRKELCRKSSSSMSLIVSKVFSSLQVA